MANCVTKYYDKNTETRISFEERTGVVVEVNITDKVVWDFYSGTEFVAFDDGVPYVVGKWQCDGDENFTITGIVTKLDGTKKNQTYSSKDNDWIDIVTDTPSQLDTAFSCIISGLTSMGKSFEIKDNRYVVATMGNKFYWYFYKPGGTKNPWVEVEEGKIILQGTWSCSTNSNFKIDSYDGKSYTGGDSDWKEDTQSEPTYDKSKFPLKLDSRGPEVAQLQNYLNKLIPFEPLVVNGIFDKKTQDKLKQLQKNLPI
jgi:hypothetical protein